MQPAPQQAMPQQAMPQQAMPQQVVVSGGARPTKMMSPMDSITNCIKGSLSFEGRASRSEFWWFVLFYQILNMGLNMVAVATEMAFISLVILVLIPAALSASARRMHDHGKSGWFMLIPFYNLYLFIIDGEAASNAYGAPPTN